MPNAIPSVGSYGARLDLKIKQGSTFGPYQVVQTNDDTTEFDLTGWTIRGQIRRTGLADDIELSLTCEITDDTAGEWEFSLAADDTETLLAGEAVTDDDSIYTYDIEMEHSSGQVISLLHGVVRHFREVTR